MQKLMLDEWLNVHITDLRIDDFLNIDKRMGCYGFDPYV